MTYAKDSLKYSIDVQQAELDGKRIEVMPRFNDFGIHEHKWLAKIPGEPYDWVNNEYRVARSIIGYTLHAGELPPVGCSSDPRQITKYTLSGMPSLIMDIQELLKKGTPFSVWAKREDEEL